MARRSEQSDLVETPGAVFGLLLRTIRESTSLTADALAERIQFDRSYVTHVEADRRKPSLAFVTACDQELHTGGTLATLYARIDWRVRALGRRPDWFDRYLLLESEAVTLREWDPYNVSGLLQTEAHMRALFTRRGHAAKRIEELIEIRLNRQRRLYGPSALRLSVLMDEGVLRRQVGGLQTMVEQLTHLLRMSQLPNVVIQVVPLFPRPAVPPGTLMALLNLADGEQWFYSEALSAAFFVDAPSEVLDHAHIYQQTAGCALSVSESRKLIRDILREMINMRSPIRYSDLKIFKSSYSADAEGNCVGVSRTHLPQGIVPIVDTTLGDASPILSVSTDAFRAFVAAVKAGEFPTA
ncbi:helix-turn-helix domain-containing protein [Streptacidiphilus sp. PB12-B1b]|uniref:Scr1 family TA system antitoxin-like transcriptional regulator n=1 Tax=Streptacidiphilus sp. PB12-B1b TaxID=2705012 RepID=UPI0015F786AE|nr:Scr1 family TA system antitoxin-like transcriptional regulator [Streptacidiphilus sp. PB12-B1b]QMU74993.1 helix-turn-helix domain-containing protein [Streptacidiphilus sp. PB12-B1b]